MDNIKYGDCRGRLVPHAARSIDPYEELANAIILQAVKDYRLHRDKRKLAEIEQFFRSEWFYFLTDIDPEMLISRLRGEKKRYEQ